MQRTLLAAAILAAVPALASAQSASAPLIVTATVVSTCKIDAPRLVEPSRAATLPVAVTCTRRGTAARAPQRPAAPRRSVMRDAVLVIDF
jgi:hypothetical protein